MPQVWRPAWPRLYNISQPAASRIVDQHRMAYTSGLAGWLTMGSTGADFPTRAWTRVGQIGGRWQDIVHVLIALARIAGDRTAAD